MSKIVVISVGGSLINPGKINVLFLKRLKSFVNKSKHKFILVCGGGINARSYPKVAGQFGVNTRGRDEIGIKATLLNAELVRHIFKAPPVQQIPEKMPFKKVLVAAGWLPGCSTDYDAVLWARKFNLKHVFNISNVDYVYNKNPKQFKDAKPLKKLSWREYERLISSKWSSGMSVPFDPVASRAAEKHKMGVFFINGGRLSEINKVMNNQAFVGTVIV